MCMLIMSSSIYFIYYVCILLSPLLTLKVDSQIQFPSSKDDDRPGISSDCNCTIIGRCPVLRNRSDWETAGVKCGYGNGRYRRVCCPAPSRLQEGTARPEPPVETPHVPRPTVESVPPYESSPENGVCGVSSYKEPLKPLIIGGENATDGQWPWMVAIRKRTPTGYLDKHCSAFLIGKRHVMSAAHCFKENERDVALYKARIGNINQKIADEYSVTRMAIHPDYKDGRYYDDIAILTLDREVNFRNFYPVCLPNEQVSKIKLEGRGTTVAGWGTDSTDRPMTDYLQFLAQLPVIERGECQRRLRTKLNTFRRTFPDGITKGIICAAFEESNKDACWGDSGGPQMIQSGNRWYVVGVVSFGFHCGLPGMPGGYTRVANYMDWISQNIKD